MPGVLVVVRGMHRAHPVVCVTAAGAAKAEFCCWEVLFLITDLGAATRVTLLGQMYFEVLSN